MFKDIAIIGMACQVPGAKNVQEFWDNLLNGKETISFFDDEELIESGILGEKFNKKNYIKAKGYLIDSEKWDAGFFDFNPTEAATTDPQLRKLLECSWELFENAGYDVTRIDNRVGVFCGSYQSDYLKIINTNEEIIEKIGKLQARIRNDKDFLPTWISYKLNLKGPSMAIQTACSSSLVAVHTACQSILSGDCEMAIAGGVSLSFPEKEGYTYIEGSIDSPDGSCRAFDENAKGTVRGNGVGLILLKLLDDAISDQDNIYAIIKGSAINNDGNNKIGYTAPSPIGQVDVIKHALQKANISNADMDYIECHGTGTPLGDEIELAALLEVFGYNKELLIGSVKSNIGHLDAAAGVIGLIKAALTLRNNIVPPSINVKNPNSILHSSKICINTEKTIKKNYNYAGVSSFGVGGTNAHVILEKNNKEANMNEMSSTCPLILISGKDEESFLKNRDNYNNFVKSDGNLDQLKIVTQGARAKFKFRNFLVNENLADFKNTISNLTPYKYDNKEYKITFLFPGQGSQFKKMGINLYYENALFKKYIDSCLTICDQFNKEIRRNFFNDEPDSILDTKYVQPLLFCIEYALSKTLMDYNVKPDYMIGHSIGEYVAACLSNVMSLKAALALIIERGILMSTAKTGSMLAVKLTVKEVKKYLHQDVSIAAINTGDLIVLSGGEESILEIRENLNNEKIYNQLLATSHAFHSHMMDNILPPFYNYAKKINFNKPDIPYISNITGDWMTIEPSPEYWTKHLRETVNFFEGINKIHDEDENHIFIEVGPGNSLSYLLNMMNANKVLQVLPKSNAASDFYSLLGELWNCNLDINWNVNKERLKEYSALAPTYQFNYKSHTIKSLLNDDPADLLEKETNINGMQQSQLDLNRSNIEETVLQAWKTIFGMDDIKPDDDFFDLGGNSLIAIQLSSIINNKLDLDFSLTTLFESSTAGEFVNLIINLWESENIASVPISKEGI